MMEKSWLEKFYTECGREVSLAYNVLNHTNTWGVTLITAFLATIFISAIEFKGGNLTLHYPTTIHWFLVIGAWIALMRFFVRSALGLANMYRWNELIYSSSKVLSLPENSPAVPIYIRNCAKKIDSYYYRFHSPVARWKIVWHSLKLMYLWFFIAVLVLFIWGLLVLDRNWQYYLGIAVFIVAVLLEFFWFVRWHGLQYEKLDLEEEPSILQLWHGIGGNGASREHNILVLGLCEEGPYKPAISVLKNPDVKWLPWSYHAASVDSRVINDLAAGCSFANKRVGFASWPADFRGRTSLIRLGRIDYFKAGGGHLRMTVTLEDWSNESQRLEVGVNDPRILCFYTNCKSDVSRG